MVIKLSAKKLEKKDKTEAHMILFSTPGTKVPRECVALFCSARSRRGWFFRHPKWPGMCLTWCKNADVKLESVEMISAPKDANDSKLAVCHCTQSVSLGPAAM